MGFFGRNKLYEKLDEYNKWLEEETERHRQKQVVPLETDEDKQLDAQLEQWKDNARKANGWKK